jgi:hypothetical protein
MRALTVPFELLWFKIKMLMGTSAACSYLSVAGAIGFLVFGQFVGSRLKGLPDGIGFVHICVYLVLSLNRLLPHGYQTVAASNVEKSFCSCC